MRTQKCLEICIRLSARQSRSCSMLLCMLFIFSLFIIHVILLSVDMRLLVPPPVAATHNAMPGVVAGVRPHRGSTSHREHRRSRHHDRQNRASVANGLSPVSSDDSAGSRSPSHSSSLSPASRDSQSRRGRAGLSSVGLGYPSKPGDTDTGSGGRGFSSSLAGPHQASDPHGGHSRTIGSKSGPYVVEQPTGCGYPTNVDSVHRSSTSDDSHLLHYPASDPRQQNGAIAVHDMTSSMANRIGAGGLSSASSVASMSPAANHQISGSSTAGYPDISQLNNFYLNQQQQQLMYAQHHTGLLPPTVLPSAADAQFYGQHHAGFPALVPPSGSYNPALLPSLSVQQYVPPNDPGQHHLGLLPPTKPGPPSATSSSSCNISSPVKHKQKVADVVRMSIEPYYHSKRIDDKVGAVAGYAT